LSCITANDLQLVRLADAIAQRVGQQRFHVWFNNSTRLDLRQDGLEIAVPNDFISEWIGKNFTRPIQEAAHEVLGCPLQVRFSVVPELFEVESDRNGLDGGAALAPAEGRATTTKNAAKGKATNGHANGKANGNGHAGANGTVSRVAPFSDVPLAASSTSNNSGTTRNRTGSEHPSTSCAASWIGRV